jgi:hypothetical protein
MSNRILRYPRFCGRKYAIYDGISADQKIIRKKDDLCVMAVSKEDCKDILFMTDSNRITPADFDKIINRRYGPVKGWGRNTVKNLDLYVPDLWYYVG